MYTTEFFNETKEEYKSTTGGVPFTIFPGPRKDRIKAKMRKRKKKGSVEIREM